MRKITPQKLMESFDAAFESFFNEELNSNVRGLSPENLETAKCQLFPSGQLTQFILAQVFREMDLLESPETQPDSVDK